MADKNIFDIYGGLDTRESYGNEGSILSYTKAKNIDIDGKVVRRARGQTQVSIAPSGSTWAGIAPAPGGFIGGINDGKYCRTDPVTLISTPIYTLIFYIPSNLSAVYDDTNSTVNLTWQNHNGTDTDIEVWLKIDDGEYTLIETGLSNWLGGDIPTGVTHDVSALGYGTFYYKVRAANDRGYSDYSTETSVSVTIPGPKLSLDSYERQFDDPPTACWWGFSWDFEGVANFKLYIKKNTGPYMYTVWFPNYYREYKLFTQPQTKPSAGDIFTFKLTAVVDGVEIPSNEVVKEITIDDVILAPPTNLRVDPNNPARITWNQVSNNLGYEVYYAENAPDEPERQRYSFLGTCPQDQNYFYCPNPGEPYWNYYKVIAVNNIRGETPLYGLKVYGWG